MGAVALSLPNRKPILKEMENIKNASTIKSIVCPFDIQPFSVVYSFSLEIGN